MIKLFSLFMVLVLSSCAFNKSDTTTAENQRDIQRELEKKAEYANYTGTYIGTVYAQDTEFPVQITIYTLSEETGKNSRGEPVLETKLKGFYRRLDIVTNDARFEVRMVQETGELNFVNNLAKNTEDIHTINASLKDETITGIIKTTAGELGNFTAKLTTKAVQIPAEGDQKEKNERLRRMYAPLEGTYVGIVYPPPQIAAPFEITLRIVTINEVTENGTIVKLNSYYNRSDLGNDLSLSLNIDYQPEFKPARIFLSGQKNTGSGFLLSVNITGIIKDSNIVGTYKDQRNYIGQVSLIKQ